MRVATLWPSPNGYQSPRGEKQPLPTPRGMHTAEMDSLTTDAAAAAAAGHTLEMLDPRLLTKVLPRYLRELEGRKAQEERSLDPVAAPRRLDVDALLTQPSPSTPSSRAAFGLHPRDVAQHNDNHNHGQDSNGGCSSPIFNMVWQRLLTTQCNARPNTVSGP